MSSRGGRWLVPAWERCVWTRPGPEHPPDATAARKWGESAPAGLRSPRAAPTLLHPWEAPPSRPARATEGRPRDKGTSSSPETAAAAPDEAESFHPSRHGWKAWGGPRMLTSWRPACPWRPPCREWACWRETCLLQRLSNHTRHSLPLPPALYRSDRRQRWSAARPAPARQWLARTARRASLLVNPPARQRTACPCRRPGWDGRPGHVPHAAGAACGGLAWCYLSGCERCFSSGFFRPGPRAGEIQPQVKIRLIIGSKMHLQAQQAQCFFWSTRQSGSWQVTNLPALAALMFFQLLEIISYLFSFSLSTFVRFHWNESSFISNLETTKLIVLGLIWR